MLLLLLLPAVACAAFQPPAREPGSFYPPDADYQASLERFLSLRKEAPFEGMIKREEAERLRRDYLANPARYATNEWLAVADYWAAKDDDFLRAMLPAENPRQLVPSYSLGCPLHLGSIATLQPVWGQANRWRCTVGGEEWAPGLPVRNPGTGQEVVIEDRGSGWACPAGFPNPGTYHFVAAYRLFTIRCLLSGPYVKPVEFDGPLGRGPIWCLGWAAALTGRPAYVHKALVILARLADIYPGLTSLQTWRNYPGRAYIDDHNFECAIIRNSVEGYDLMWGEIAEDRAILEWFGERGERDYNGDGRVDHLDLKLHIERNVFGHMYEFTHRALPVSRGNSRTWQFEAMAELAVHFRHDLLFEECLNSRYGFRQLLLNCLYRDGRYYEDSTGYAMGVNQAYLHLGQLMGAFQGRRTYPSGVDTAALLGERYRKITTFGARDASAARTPEWGDGGGSRKPMVHPRPQPQPSELMMDIGYSIMRSQGSSAQQQHLLLNFTQNGAGHGHRSQLMLKPIAFGYDLSADLGYPHNLLSPKRDEWVAHAATHGTVVVDSRDQRVGSAGSLDFYLDRPWLKATAASSDNVYEHVPLYHRTALLVSLADDAHFIVDLFRVRGGQRRDYLYHSLSGEQGERFVLQPGGNPAPQPLPGTLAGPEVAWMANTGRGATDSVDEQPERKSGYSYLKDLRTTSAAGDWSCQWQVGDPQATSLNLWMAGSPGRQLILARGEHNGAPGLSPWDAYLVARDDNQQTGRDTSLFAAVMEAAQGRPKVTGVRFLPLAVPQDDGLAVAVHVTTSAGEFTVLSSLDPARSYAFQDGDRRLTLQGALAVVRQLPGAAPELTHLNAPRVELPEVQGAGGPAYGGTVTAVDWTAPAVTVQTA
ncbi:MAG: hypothetical protein HUU35_14335, partial [Armatimonadetes bacterium]|nr:hypothetical protein [Armatimonadota bacterium]